jgi:hypothetical protein
MADSSPNSTSKSPLSRLFAISWPSEDYDSPIWTLRLSPALALLCILLGETVCKAGFLHGICFGIAAGQLFVLCIVSLQVKGITLRNTPPDPGLQQLHLTR